MRGVVDISEIDIMDILEIYPKLPIERGFGDAGRLAIVGGGYLNYNPPLISALVSTIFPIDSVYLLIPEKIARLKGFFNVTVSTIYLPDFKVTNGVVNKILKLIGRRRLVADVFHLGPGFTGYKNYILKLIAELNSSGYFLLLDSGALYQEILSMDLDWSRVVLSPHEGEIKQLFGVDSPDNLKDKLGKENILAKFIEGLYFYKEGRLVAKYIYSGHKPLKYGVNYVITGIFSSYLTLTKNIERAGLLTLFTYMKTVENLYEKNCLHWSIEDLISSLKDVLIDLCMGSK